MHSYLVWLIFLIFYYIILEILSLEDGKICSLNLVDIEGDLCANTLSKIILHKIYIIFFKIMVFILQTIWFFFF